MKHALVGWMGPVFLVLCAASAAAQTIDADIQVQMAEARRRFDALEYEQTVPPLDRVIELLRTRQGDDARRVLTEALEIRARSRYGLGDQDGTRQDFIALLKANPAHVLGSNVSSRVVAIYDEAKKATVTTLKLTVTPDTATVLLDGVRVSASGDIPVLLGDHAIAVTRAGYRPENRTFTATSETAAEVSLELTRTSAVLSVVTSPADVEVLIDGVSRGRTTAGPLPQELAARAASAGIVATDATGTLTLADLTTGNHRIELRRACFVQVERQQNIAQLGDFAIDPVKLVPAMATIVASSQQADAMVFVDGESRGRAPQTIQVCEGAHLIELRAPTGRFVQRLDARAGQRMEVSGSVRPAFALVSSTQTSLNADLRGAIERAFEPVKSILVFAPPQELLESALKAEKLPADWLGYDANRRPFGVSAEVTPAMRRDLSTKLARSFDAQGIAAVTAPVSNNRTRLVLTLLGAGIAEPDVIEVNLDQADTVARAVTQLDRALAFSTPTIGLSVVDVADVPGPVVASVDAGGPAAQAGLRTGDILVSANAKPVADAAAVASVVAALGAGQSVIIEAKDPSGTTKKSDVKVLMRPRLLSIADQTLLVNRTLVTLRARLAEAKDAAEQAAIRLNLAAALIRLESWADARAELQQVTLTDGPGVGTGTIQYLLGLCASRLGNRAEAETAFKAAAASANLLTEDGPPVRELAEARLQELSRAPAPR